MRTLIVLSVLIVPLSVSSQTDRLTRGEQVLMAAAGVAAGAAVVMAAGDEPGVIVFLAVPAVAGGAVYGVGRALGNRGQLGSTMIGAAAGTLPALVLFAAADSAQDRDPSDDVLLVDTDTLLLAVAGAVAYLVLPPLGATLGFGMESAGPALLRGPGGERAPGLALRVAL